MASNPDFFQIDDEDIEQLLELLERDYEEVVAQEAGPLMKASVELARAEVVARTPVGVAGNLRGSIAGDIRGRWPELEGEVMTPLVYGEVIERGRQPRQKWPPQDAIELWVRRKLGISDGAEQVAFLIARKIGRKGFKGRWMFREAAKIVRPQINQLWKDQLIARVVREITRRIEAIGRE